MATLVPAVLITPVLVVVPSPLIVEEPLTVVVPPCGPVTVPLVAVPLELMVVVPFAVVVPPLGPVTVADSVAPVRVRVALPSAETVVPLALVAVAVPETVLPLREAEAEAVPPRGPVRECCASAGRVRRKIAVVRAMFFMGSSSFQWFAGLSTKQRYWFPALYGDLTRSLRQCLRTLTLPYE